MADITLYHGIAFSPQATLTDKVGAADTIIKVLDVSAFPDAPNLATIGTDEDGETILYTAKTADALSGCQRGIEGEAKAWDAGELIGRNFTAKDHNDLIDAVGEAKSSAASAITAAREARTTAEGAVSTASSAATTAGEAKTTAEGAASTASAASSNASNALTTAGAAKTAAESAVTTAGEAKSTAESAASTAGGAASTASAAAASVDAINKAKGAAGGFASLDGSGVVPAAQRRIVDDSDSSKKYTLGVEGGKLYFMEV